MKKKHCTFWILAGVVTSLLMTQFSAIAADKVVVIPLFGSGSGDKIPTVTSKTGRVWMDRNLGAIRVAGSKSDSLAYGWLYQWGRLADGHESRTSPSTAVNNLSIGDVPGHGNFIPTTVEPNDWTNAPNNHLWEGVTGVNNPCPTGFRIPTAFEWMQEAESWNPGNIEGAFTSALKIPSAGMRYYDWPTEILYEGIIMYYWSSDVSGDEAKLIFGNKIGIATYSFKRANAASIRCIKD